MYLAWYNKSVILYFKIAWIRAVVEFTPVVQPQFKLVYDLPKKANKKNNTAYNNKADFLIKKEEQK